MPLNDSYFLNPAHLQIARERYFLKGPDGEPVETDIEQVFRREVDHVYQNDTPENREEAFRLRCEKKILPAGRPLAQSGTGVSNLYNCFSLGISDSREEISKTKTRHFHLAAYGGGIGIDFSDLRPNGSICKTTQGHASGPIGFLTDISYSSSNISQSGNRSGAGLALLHDWHPDLYEFVTFKSEHNHERLRKFATILNEDEFAYWQWDNHHKWQMFNVSVGVSNLFMQQAIEKKDKPWILKWKDEEWPLWDFVNKKGPITGKDTTTNITVTAPNREIAFYKAKFKIPWGNAQALELTKGPYHLTAKNYLDMIAKNAWEDGCPGVMFIDTIREFHNLEYCRPFKVSNACSEIPLSMNSACNLTAVVIPSFMKDGSLDKQELDKATRQVVRGLDNIIDISDTGLEDFNQNMQNERRIGVGTTGMAEYLAMRGLKYSSPEGRAAVSEVLELVRDSAYEASIDLADERGAFPLFDFEGYSKSKFFATLPEHIRDNIEEHGIRNCTLLTAAPNGTTGTISGYSQGCEPYYSVMFKRNSKVGTFVDGSPLFRDMLAEKKLNYEDFNYSLVKLTESYPEFEVFEEAHTIPVEYHLEMQAVYQKYVCNAVSKTVNTPNSATIDEIRNIFCEAWKKGIKSTTVYRDGSKQQVLEHLKKDKELSTVVASSAPKRPKELPCDIHHVTVRGNKWIVMIGLMDDKPYELFCAEQEAVEIGKKYKSGILVKQSKTKYSLDLEDFIIKDIGSYLTMDEHKVITRLLSANMRHGVEIDFLVKQLDKVAGNVTDFSRAIVRVLSRYKKESKADFVCEQCGAAARKTSTCYECDDCGWSKCD